MFFDIFTLGEIRGFPRIAGVVRFTSSLKPFFPGFPRIAGVVPSKRDDIAINLGFPRIAGVVPWPNK